MKIFALGSGSTGRVWKLSLGALGVSMVFLAAPSALADDTESTLVGPPPAAESTAQIAEAAVQVPAVGTPESSATGAAAAPADPAATAAPEPVSHLSSPDNLPPGTTDTAPQKQTRLGYLREVWQAIQTQDVTMGDAVLFLAQRPLDASATPPPGVATGPSGPVGTSAPAAVVAPAAGAATP